MFELLPLIFLLPMVVSFWAGRKRGYSGLLMALITFVFPLMVVFVFFLPDRNEMKRNAQTRNIREGAASLDLRARDELQRTSTSDLFVRGIKNALEENDVEAMSFFLEAAKRGHADAQAICGERYMEGKGCTADVKQALYWHEKAAEQGVLRSQKACASLYAKEFFHKEKALYWYRKVAEQGAADAQYMYAVLVDDPNEARHWMEQAAAQGHKLAEERLQAMMR